MSIEPKVYHPMRAVKVAIERNARDQYVEQVKAFANTFAFTPTFSQTSPDPNDIVVHLERDNVWMVGVMVTRLSATNLAYEFAFYTKRDQPISSTSLDPLVEGLRLYLGRVQGAVVTETQLER
jgi:hypothetical protein